MADAAYYPPPVFAFSVAVASGTTPQSSTSIDGAFLEISGIDPKVETVELVEGGINSYVHQLPGPTKHANLTLKRGYVTQASALAKWAGQCVGSTYGTAIATQTLNVNLLNPSGQPLITWTFQNAWPVKWEVGQLDATNSSTVLTQTLEIAYTTVVETLAAAAS